MPKHLTPFSAQEGSLMVLGLLPWFNNIEDLTGLWTEDLTTQKYKTVFPFLSIYRLPSSIRAWVNETALFFRSSVRHSIVVVVNGIIQGSCRYIIQDLVL